jgi:lysophospholipase L1-like esterase
VAEVTLEFLGQQVALVLEGQREIKARLDKIEATLPTLATKDLVTQVWNALDSKLHASELGEQLMRERLERRVAELERAR